MFVILSILTASSAPHPQVHHLPAITVAARVQCADAPRLEIRDPFTNRKLIYCYLPK